MMWIELKSKVKKLLLDRDLAKPNIRLNALEKLEQLIKSNFSQIYKNPVLLLQIEKEEFKNKLMKYKKLNSAESSVVNNFYQILSNIQSPLYAKRERTSIKDKAVKANKSKPDIVESEKEMKNPVYGLKPVVNEKTKILILGTFPAKESIDEKYYYQNQINTFWGQALSEVASFINISNDERENLLLENNIGLWDIFECVQRGKSNQDKALQKAKYNNLEQFLKEHSSINYLICNGGSTYEWLNEDKPEIFKIDNVEVKKLQSSSRLNGHFKNGKDWKEYFKTIIK